MLNKYGDVINNAGLVEYNTYGIKTSAKYLVKPDSIDKLSNLINYLNKENIKYLILGKGSNVILPDTLFDGVIISLEKLNNIEIDDTLVSAECGILLSTLAKTCISSSLEGLEYLALIPGTLGGALYGNAGVKEHTIYDNLESVLVIRGGKLKTLKKEDIKIDYRYTEFKDNNDILVSAIFNLKKENRENLEKIVKENRIKRLNSQPLEYKNAGSVFKNPENNFAGKLIEEAGLKGYHINDAEVSIKHANFIVNKGNATSKDIKELIKTIQKKIRNKYNIELELEQIIVEWD